MTAPRQVLPGTTYLVTRRCSRRQFLLKPSNTTNEIFLYLLALAVHRFGVQLHAFCVLSNHFHFVVTDPDARLPAFMQYLNSLVARATNASLGRWESFWAPSTYSAVALETPQDTIAKIAYVLGNPVAARLVPRANEWPGLWSAPERIGGAAFVAHRPATFFRRKGYLPEIVELGLVVPRGFDSPDDFREELRAALARIEPGGERDCAHRGPGFLGAARVVAQKPWGRPVSAAPRRQLSPRVASRDKWKRMEALARLAGFLSGYRQALSAFRGGDRDALFPSGTYLLRIHHGVRCAGFA
jgi:REP element-mobilizing transposase RayT